MARSKNARSKSGACPSLCTTTTAKGELAIRLRTKNSMATYDVFTDVMEHAEKFSHVTTPEGAFAFNQMFEEPVLMEEQVRPPHVHVSVIDAVARDEKDWAGLTTSYIEYLVKMSIEGNEANIKIVGKRFSELSDLHTVLVDRKKLDMSKAPVFPDKNNLHQNWFKFNDKDPKSEHVQQRRSNLETYFKKLFETHPSLPFDPLVMAFFQLEELSMEAAIATSRKTQKYAEGKKGSDTAEVAPVTKTSRQYTSSSSKSNGKGGAANALLDETVDV